MIAARACGSAPTVQHAGPVVVKYAVVFPVHIEYESFDDILSDIMRDDEMEAVHGVCN